LANNIYTDRRQMVQTLAKLTVATAEHTHTIAQVTGLQTALDSLAQLIEQRAGQAHQHAMSDIIGLSNAFMGKANASHGHSISDVTGLQNALDSKVNSGHTHSISQITDLSTTLASKAASSHTHTLPNIVAAEGSVNYQFSIVSGALVMARLN
jgi:hypothetical protein